MRPVIEACFCVAARGCPTGSLWRPAVRRYGINSKNLLVIFPLCSGVFMATSISLLLDGSITERMDKAPHHHPPAPRRLLPVSPGLPFCPGADPIRGPIAMFHRRRILAGERSPPRGRCRLTRATADQVRSARRRDCRRSLYRHLGSRDKLAFNWSPEGGSIMWSDGRTAPSRYHRPQPESPLVVSATRECYRRRRALASRVSAGPRCRLCTGPKTRDPPPSTAGGGVGGGDAS